MKDTRDHKTGDLLKSKGARRQAEFKARMREQGRTQASLWLIPADRAAGAVASQAGLPSAPPAGVDALSWLIGWAETLPVTRESVTSNAEKALPVTDEWPVWVVELDR